MMDLFLTTMPQYPKNEYRNLMVQNSYFYRNFFRDSKPKDMTGTHATFNAIIQGDAGDGNRDATKNGFGLYDGAYDTIPAVPTEYMTQGKVDWSAYIGHVAISEKELIENSSREAYIELHKAKYEGAMTRMANILELDWWSRDAFKTIGTGRQMILGPEYWITDDGYAINDPAGINGIEVGGINPTHENYRDPITGRNRWRNQARRCAVPNDLIRAMTRLVLSCKFVTPPDVNMNTKPGGERHRIVFNLNGYLVWVDMMQMLNEPFSVNEPRFRNVKVEKADLMSRREDGTNQGFFFDLDTWKARVAKGMDMKWDEIERLPNQPSAKRRNVKYWPASWCTDRRNNGKVFGFGDDIIEN